MTTRIGAPWYLRLGAWIGIGTGPGALATGGGIASFLSFSELVVAVPLGVGIFAFLAGSQALRGRRTSEAMVGLVRMSFGKTFGPRAIAVLIYVGIVGWTGFYVGVAGGAVSELTGIHNAVAGLAFATILWLIYLTGRSSWDVAVALAGLSAITVAIMVVAGVPAEASTSQPAGIRLTAVLAGAGGIVAYPAIFSVRCADFAWDLRSDRDVLRAVSVMITTLVLFVGLGAGMYFRAGAWDLADLTNRTTYPTAAVVLLVVSAVAPSVSGLHSGALAFQGLLRSRERTAAGLLAFFGGILGAWRFDLMLLPFLEILGILVPPVVATMLFQRDGQPTWHAWISWTSGAAMAGFAVAARWPGPVVIGLVMSAVVVRCLGLSREESYEGSYR